MVNAPMNPASRIKRVAALIEHSFFGQGPHQTEQQAAHRVDQQRAPGKLGRYEAVHQGVQTVAGQGSGGAGHGQQDQALPELGIGWGHGGLWQSGLLNR